MISSYRKTVFTSENTSSSMVADGGRRRHGHNDRWEEDEGRRSKCAEETERSHIKKV